MRPLKGVTKIEWETIHLLNGTKIKFLGVKYYFLCSSPPPPKKKKVCVCVCWGWGEEVCEVYFAYEHEVSHGPLVGKHWYRTQNSQSHFFTNCGTYILCCIHGKAINNGMSYLWWLCVHEIGSSVWVHIFYVEIELM